MASARYALPIRWLRQYISPEKYTVSWRCFFIGRRASASNIPRSAPALNENHFKRGRNASIPPEIDGRGGSSEKKCRQDHPQGAEGHVEMGDRPGDERALEPYDDPAKDKKPLRPAGVRRGPGDADRLHEGPLVVGRDPSGAQAVETEKHLLDSRGSTAPVEPAEFPQIPGGGSG